ncbi:Transcriptional regulatory protein SAP30 [Spathaspora sp. JA1]|nr:Transcriptional regulatory protein SAP30 [Spathaspora sp. JA1]
MPPRSHRESASESESSRNNTIPGGSSNSGSKSTQKAKNQAAQAIQQNYLARHITSNGPQDRAVVHPLDFEAFDDSVLMRYNEKYGLNLPRPETVNYDILNSEIGKKTFSKRSKKREEQGRISKPELAKHLKSHFMALGSKENEIITGFLYKVKHQDNDFKLTF